MATNASNVTENLGLSQWSREDEFRMEDFNADNLAIDEAFGGISDIVAESLGGVLKAETGTYTGTGTSSSPMGGGGSNSPTVIYYDITPVLIFIKRLGNYGNTLFAVCGADRALAMTSDTNPQETNLTWGNGCVTLTNSSYPASQMNTNGGNYKYVIIGY